MKMRKVKVSILAGALALASIGVAYAYFSGTADQKANEFHIVAGSEGQTGAGAITETQWDIQKEVDTDGDGIKDVMEAQPGQTFNKDPKLTSAVEYDAVGYIKVSMPTIEAKKTGDTEPQVYDAFELGGINSGFTKVKEVKSTTAGTDSVYVYRYDTRLKNTDSTPELFTTITVPEFTSIATALTDAINVDAALVQCEGHAAVGSDGAVSDATEADTAALGLLGVE